MPSPQNWAIYSILSLILLNSEEFLITLSLTLMLILAHSMHRRIRMCRETSGQMTKH
jgi:hypothetical protein